MNCTKQMGGKNCKKTVREEKCPGKKYGHGNKCISPSGRDQNIPMAQSFLASAVRERIQTST